MDKQHLNIILSGAPGSGKSTQVEILEAKGSNFNFISVGKILRDISKQDSDLGRKVKEVMAKGDLVDEFFVNELVKDKLRNVDKSKPIIFDGYPRNLGQLNSIDQMFLDNGLDLPALVYIKISKEESIKRLSDRLVCSECKENFSESEVKGKEECIKCGGKLVKRDDDKPEAIQNRFEIFEMQFELIKHYFEKRNRYYEINGERGKEEIHKSIMETINSIK